MINIPEGFMFSGVKAGIKKSGKRDLGLVLADKPLNAVCYFTDNSFKAAPLLLSIEKIKKTNSVMQAIIVNSGNANCFTGKKGMAAAKKECACLAGILGIDENLVHASSTGIIKKPLPVEKIIKAMPGLAARLSRGGINEFNDAIMTTDTFPKVCSELVKIGGKVVTICGVAKGAGMIWPNVKPHATMLVYIFSDVDMAKDVLKKITAGPKGVIEKTFNSITVDGCTSTNDSVFILTSARAGNRKINIKNADCALFEKALSRVCLNLAQKIARDGEGATKLIEIRIKGAKNEAQAKKAGLAVANSFLFKTAVYGANKNIGRIAQALGQEHIIDSCDNIGIYCNDLKKENVKFTVDLKQGKAGWTVWTCDISEDYVKINAEYN